MKQLLDKVRAARRVFIIGNGGSYANAQHIANDLLACGIAAFTLDAATLTATANDYGYEQVFERWLSVVAERHDLLIALSGSGKSPNILRALQIADSIGMETAKIFGAELEQNMQLAEEYQLIVGHELMRALRK
jgi:D-sedoheptulose 7-phosphate isomerase